MAIINEQIKCSDCQTFKYVDSFQPSIVKRGSGQCRPCKHKRKFDYYQRNKKKCCAAVRKSRDKNKDHHLKIQKVWRKNNKEKIAGYNLKKNYGLSLNEYSNFFEKQKGFCACCGSKSNGGRKLYVDHCHENGNIRGLLCHKCNTGIASLGDNLIGVTNASKYLMTNQVLL